MTASPAILERQGGVEQEEVRRLETGLHALAGHDVAEAVRDQRRPAFVDEAQGARESVAGLEGLEDGLMVVEAGVAVPGHADEARIAPQRAQAFEGLRLPAPGGLRRDAVAVDHHDPARSGLFVRQAGRLIDGRRSRRFLGSDGLAGEGPREVRQPDVTVHRFDGADRER